MTYSLQNYIDSKSTDGQPVTTDGGKMAWIQIYEDAADVRLDGRFTADELEAIAAYLRSVEAP